MTLLFRRLLLALSMLLPLISVSAQQRFNDASQFVGHYATNKFNLVIEPHGNYRQEWGDCTTESYEQGTYHIVDGLIALVVVKRGVRERGEKHWKNLLDPKVWKRLESSDEPWPLRWQLFPITWGQRLYLMEKSDFINFTNAINFGLEPRAGAICDWPVGGFYLREGDGSKQVAGWPSLPNDTIGMLLNKPVESTIVAIEGDGDARVAILNRGANARLRPGMRFLRQNGQPKFWGGMEIISTTESSARMSLDEQAKVGDKVISRFERVRLEVRLNQ